MWRSAGDQAPAGPCRSFPVVMQLEAMTRQEYEERRRRLDEELSAGRELLEASHRAQVRALDLHWAAEQGSAAPEIAPAPEKRRGFRVPTWDSRVATRGSRVRTHGSCRHLPVYRHREVHALTVQAR